MTLCIRQRRQADEAEATTAGSDFFDQIGEELKKTFTADNLKKTTDQLTNLGNKFQVRFLDNFWKIQKL